MVSEKALDFEQSIQSTLLDIVTEQAQYFTVHGKYFQASPEVTGGVMQIHEYVGPLGAGYMAILESDGWIKVADFGPEGHSADWHQKQELDHD